MSKNVSNDPEGCEHLEERVLALQSIAAGIEDMIKRATAEGLAPELLALLHTAREQVRSALVDVIDGLN